LRDAVGIVALAPYRGEARILGGAAPDNHKVAGALPNRDGLAELSDLLVRRGVGVDEKIVTERRWLLPQHGRGDRPVQQYSQTGIPSHEHTTSPRLRCRTPLVLY